MVLIFSIVSMREVFRKKCLMEDLEVVGEEISIIDLKDD